MDLKMDAIEMSLDDYIAISKKANLIGASNSKHDDNGSVYKDAKFGRRKGNIDDEEEDEDFLLKEENEEETMNEDEATTDTGIWKGPDASVAYIDCNDQQNDLRDKLNNNNRNQCTAVQYRLMAPNNSADRPRGIPTLLPLDAYVSKQNNRNNNGPNNRRRRNRGNFNGGNRGFNNNNFNNNNHTNNGFNNNHNNNNFRGNGKGGVTNGRIQRNRNQDLNKNLRQTFNRNDNPYKTIGGVGVEMPKNLLIQRDSRGINLQPGSQLHPSLQVPHCSNNVDSGNRSMPIGNLTPQAQAVLDLNANSNQAPKSNNNNDLKSILGFESPVSGEMMPVFASRLLEYLKNNAKDQVHKPIYDMKIQKDIHEIQNKPLLYKCPGGEVVSSDGAGVNCKIIPRTSGLSLNCRFA